MSERLGPGLEMCSLDYNQPSIQQELPYGKDHGGPPVHGIIQGRKGSIPLDIIVAAMMRLQQISKHAKERRRRGQQRIRIIIGVMLKDGANLSLESCNGEIHPTKSNFRQNLQFPHAIRARYYPPSRTALLATPSSPSQRYSGSQTARGRSPEENMLVAGQLPSQADLAH